MPTMEEENAALKKRIAELAEMLNNASRVTKLEVESERDACERAVRFLADHSKDEVRKKAFEEAADAIKNRKDPTVRWISEMAHGTMLGEFIQKMVEEQVAKLKASSPGA